MTSATSAIRRTLSVTALPFVLSLFGALACYTVAGPSLNLFLGLLVLLIILAPTLVMAEESAVARLTALAAMFLPMVAVGFFALEHSEIYFGEWWRTTAIIVLFAFALAALSVALLHLKFPMPVPAALFVMVGVVWLSWPIGGSRTGQGENTAAPFLPPPPSHPGILIIGRPHV